MVVFYWKWIQKDVGFSPCRIDLCICWWLVMFCGKSTMEYGLNRVIYVYIYIYTLIYMETRGRSSIFRIWDLHSLAINFCWQWRLFIFGVSMIWTWCAVPLHKICIRHCTGINFIMYKRIIKCIKHWVYNYLNKSPTMFHGKINYKWQFFNSFLYVYQAG